MKTDGAVAPRASWTWSVVPQLVDHLRRLEGRPDLPYYFIGHSAGGQFLVRMTGFVPTDAARIVAANPGAELFPSRDFRYPYGFGGLPASLSSDEQIRAYLARPLTLYLVGRDTVRDEDLDTSKEADRQGRSRYERGKNAFRRAQDLAREKGWDFRWRLVEAPAIGHDHQAMFDAPECRDALFGPGRR